MGEKHGQQKGGLKAAAAACEREADRGGKKGRAPLLLARLGLVRGRQTDEMCLRFKQRLDLLIGRLEPECAVPSSLDAAALGLRESPLAQVAQRPARLVGQSDQLRVHCAGVGRVAKRHVLQLVVHWTNKTKGGKKKQFKQ